MTQQHKQPDILMIMPDQMRGDCLSALGHPGVRTPNLDRLAREGTLFRRAYSTVTSCIPARYALLSGLHPDTSGVVGFAAKPFETPTLPQMLGDAGYTTAIVGRYMHQPPESGSCGYQREILGSTHRDDDDYDRHLKRVAPETGGIRKLIAEMGLSNNGWAAKPWPLADELHPIEWIVDRSQEVVTETPPERPLFLTTSFYSPHPPLFPIQRFWDAAAARPLPDPPMGEWVDTEQLSPDGDSRGHRVRLAGETLRRAQAGYYGLIDQIDAALARLIQDFCKRSEAAGRPWVILLMTDHGELMGDHGYYRKCQPYEGAANIPYVFAGSPELGFARRQVNKRPVCLEDVMPTLLDFAEVEIPDYLDGVSLLPTLRGEPQAVREWLHFEHAPCYSEPQAYHALTDGRYKYIWRTLDGSEQLFDLAEDPEERHDLSQDAAAAAKLEACRNRLIQILTDRPEGFVRDGRLVAGVPYPKLNPGRIPSVDRGTNGGS